MRFLPRGLRRIGKRLRRRSSGSSTRNADEDSEEQITRELEETLMENSDFLYLRGEKLRLYETRMQNLAKLLTRGGPLPADSDQLSQLRSSVSSKSPLLVGNDVPGPSRSLDSAQDLIRSVHTMEGSSEDDEEAVRSIPEWAHDVESEMPLNISDSTTMDLTPALLNLRSRSYKDFEAIEDGSEELEAVPLSVDDTPSGLSPGSIRKDALVAETTDNVFGIFTDMNDWSNAALGYSFADENSPSPLKVHSFYPQETQTVSLSLDDHATQRPRLPEPEDSFSSREGILFAIGSYAITGEHHNASYKGHLNDSVSSPSKIGNK